MNTTPLHLTLFCLVFSWARVSVSSECGSRYEVIGDKLPAGWRKKHDKVSIPIEKDKFFVGLNHRHIYLVYDGKRYDGAPVRFRSPKSNSTNLVDSESVIFEFVTKDEKLQNSLSEALNRKSIFSWSCGDGVCKILEDTGLEGPGGIRRLFPSALMSSLEKNGLRQKDGTSLPIKIFQLGDIDLADLKAASLPDEIGTVIPFAIVVGTTVYLGWEKYLKP